MNVLHIIGHVGQPPENRPYGDNKENDRVTFTVAVNKRGGRGGAEKKPDWFNVTVFGAQAQPVLQYLQKGHRVAVSGRYESNEGTGEYEGRTFWTLIASDVEFLTPKGESGSTGAPAAAAASAESDLPF